MSENLHVDLTPIRKFRYNQIANHKFQYLLLDPQNRALHTPFECKDYLQDMFYCEYTGESGEIYGMDWNPGTINLLSDTYSLALLWPKKDLSQDVTNLQTFLNHFEDALDIPRSEVLNTDSEDTIVVKFSRKWTENGPLLSSLTTIIRIAGEYKGEDPLEYLKSLPSRTKDVRVYMVVDINRMNLKRFAALLQGKKPEHNWSDFHDMMSVHNTGMVRFQNFPEVNVK